MAVITKTKTFKQKVGNKNELIYICTSWITKTTSLTMSGQIILYQTEDGKAKIEVVLDNETVWLNQKQMEELFQTDRTSIARHIKNIYKTQELDENATCAKIAQVQQEGKRNVKSKRYLYHKY